jgi:site-specific DNA recombinase
LTFADWQASGRVRTLSSHLGPAPTLAKGDGSSSLCADGDRGFPARSAPAVGQSHEDAVDAWHADQRRAQQEANTRLRVEYDRIQHRIDAMYVDKLDGRVDVARARSTATARPTSPIWTRACRFSNLPATPSRSSGARNRQKRRLLDFVLSNCSWEDGQVAVTFRQSFDLSAETAVAERQKKAAGMISDRLSVNWLPGTDSNHRQVG